MTQADLLTLLQADLNILSPDPTRLAQLNYLIEAALQLIAREGVTLQEAVFGRGWAAGRHVCSVFIPQAGHRRGDAAHASMGTEQPCFLRKGWWSKCYLTQASPLSGAA